MSARRLLLACSASLSLAIALASSACSGSPPTTPSSVPQSLLISGPRVLLEGETGTFSATVQFSDGSSRVVADGVSWSSDDPRVATISQQGNANALFAGDTRIRATYGSLGGSSQLSVEAGARVVTGRVHESAPTEEVRIAGATVTAMDSAGVTSSVATDPEGAFVLTLRPGMARLTVVASEYETSQVTVDVPPEGTSLSLPLVPVSRQVILTFHYIYPPTPDLVRQRTYRLDVYHPGLLEARYSRSWQSASAQGNTCVEVRDRANRIVAGSQGMYDNPAQLRVDVAAGAFEVKFFVCSVYGFTPSFDLQGWGGEVRYTR